MVERLLEPKLYENPPSDCPKSNCGRTVFIPHEDGWQCLNCMKIVYKANRSVRKSPVFRRYQHEKD